MKLGALAVLFFAQLAAANSSITVRSSIDSQDPYVVVYKSAEAGIDEAPGIYAPARGSQKLNALVKGEVLDVSRAFNGILAQYPMASTTSQYESLTIVDGRLAIFNNKSSARVPDSVLIFGENTPIFDGITGAKVPLEKIASSGDVKAQVVNVYYPEGEIFLISVKQTNLFGDGITFAAVLRRGAGAPKLLKPPVVINYDFLNGNRLRELHVAGSNILSRNHILSLAQSMGGEDLALRRYRASLIELAEELKPTRAEKSRRVSVLKRVDKETGRTFVPPYFDVFTRQLEIEELPIETVSKVPFSIFQRVDPRSARSAVLIKSRLDEEDFDGTRPGLIPGRVNYDPARKRYDFLDLGKTRENERMGIARGDSDSVVLLTVEDQVYLILPSAVTTGNYIATPLKGMFDKDWLRQNAAVGSQRVVMSGAKFAKHYVFISYRGERGGRQGVIEIPVAEDPHGASADTFLFLQNKFMTRADLEKRIYATNQNNRDLILYDNVTQKMGKNKLDFGGGRAPTIPFIDVEASRSHKLEQIYLGPLNSLTLGGQFIWQHYDPKGALENKTGFYGNLEINGQRNTEFMQGRILSGIDLRALRDKKSLPKFDEKSLYEILFSSKQFHLNEDDSNLFEIVGVPYLAEEDKDKVGFRVAVYVMHSRRRSQIDTLPAIANIYIPFDFSRFEGMRFVQGRRRALNDFNLLIFANEKDSASSSLHPSRGGPGLYTVSLRVTFDAFGNVNRLNLISNVDNNGWLHAGSLGPSALRSRVVFDANGDLLWAINPELDKTNRNYGYQSINKPPGEKPFYPNQGLNRVAIRHDEELEDDPNSNWGLESRWLVEGRTALEIKFPAFKKFLEERHKAQEEQKKKAKLKKEAALFPDLNDYLNSVASPENREHTVLLVDPELYDTVRNQIFMRLFDQDRGNNFSLSNHKFYFHAYDPAFPPDETERNLQRLARGGTRTDLLYVDMQALADADKADPPRTYEEHAGQVKTQDETEGEEEADKDEDEEKEEVEGPEALAEAEKSIGERILSEMKGRFALEEKRGSEKEENKDKHVFPLARLGYLAREGESVSMNRLGLPHAHRFPELILATPAQWRNAQRSFPEETRAGLFKTFKVEARFLTASWTAWNPHSIKVSPEVTEYRRNPVSKDEYQVFSGLDQLLHQIADPARPAKHQLLVVPEAIKPLVQRLIMSRWSTDLPEFNDLWNYRNKNLALFQVQVGDSTQNSVIDNFDSMRGAQLSRRPVLLADMANLLRISRPSNPDASFRIRDPIMGRKGGDIFKADEPAVGKDPEPADLEASNLPHIIWWIATEGQKIQPKKTKNWNLKNEVDPHIPTLILTTEKELRDLEQDAAFEARFMDIKEMFETVRLPLPTEEDKRNLLEELFRRPEVAALGYDFSLQKLPPDEARQQLIGLTIGRVAQIAKQLKLESTYAFLKLYVALKRALTEDIELRRSRQVDAPYLFRLFARIFPLPLSYEILRPDDPLQKLRDHELAARGLQDGGYQGSLELPGKVVRALTSHTRGGTEAGRKVPSSVVLIGDGGTGKTFLIESLINYMGLKLYDFKKPYDEEAGAIIVHVQDIIDGDEATDPDKFTVARVIAHINNFLSLPNGWRGVVLFDDLHKAGSTKILKEIMTFIQSLFDAPGGLVRVKRMSMDKAQAGEIKEIPVRNIQLGVTLNPTRDKAKRNRFIDANSKKDPVMEAVASITRTDYQIEDSVFTRFADVIDMSEFPREAKVPTLLKEMREANASEFSAYPRLVTVTPRTLDTLVNAFPSSNARDFLTPATYSLLSLPNSLAKAPLYIIDPRPDLEIALAEEEQEDDEWSSPSGAKRIVKVEPSKIEEVLRASTVIQAVRLNEPESKLHLLSLLLDNFRGLIYNNVVQAAPMSKFLSSTHEAKVTFLTSFIAGMVSNLSEFRRLPIDSVQIKPEELGVFDYDAKLDLQEAVKRHISNLQHPILQIPVHESHDYLVDLGTFLGRDDRDSQDRHRMHVLMEASQRLKNILEPLLAASLQMHALTDFHDPKAWVEHLTESEPNAIFKASTASLIEEYTRLTKELYSLSLSEMRDRQGISPMKNFDEVRLFALCLDSALAQLPWSYVTEFLLKALDISTTDLALGQKLGLQHFLFKSTYSPLVTMTPESIISNAKGISIMRGVDENKVKDWSAEFATNCEKFIRGVP